MQNTSTFQSILFFRMIFSPYFFVRKTKKPWEYFSDQKKTKNKNDNIPNPFAAERWRFLRFQLFFSEIKIELSQFFVFLFSNPDYIIKLQWWLLLMMMVITIGCFAILQFTYRLLIQSNKKKWQNQRESSMDEHTNGQSSTIYKKKMF